MTIGTVNPSFPAGTNMDQFDVGLLAAGTLSAQSSTSYKVTIGNEAVVVSGTGFTFDGSGNPTGGTVTSIQDQYLGAVNFDLTNFSLSVVTLQALAAADNNATLMSDLFSGHDTLIGGPNGDLLRGFGGNDSIIGGAGDDTLIGTAGHDTIDGGTGHNAITLGGGNDVIIIRQGLSNPTTQAFDTITGWGSTDALSFAYGPSGASDIAKTTAADYASALTAANALIAAGTDNIVITAVGSDLYVFADSANDNGVADDVVMIKGHVLSDLSVSNFTLSPAPPPPPVSPPPVSPPPVSPPPVSPPPVSPPPVSPPPVSPPPVSPPPVSPPPVSPPPVSPPPVSPPPVSPPPVSPPPVSPPPVSPPPVSPPPAPSGGSSGSASTSASTPLTLTPAAFVTGSSSILRLSSSSAAATSALSSLSTKLAAGTLTADAALKGAIALAGGTTSVATMTYEFFTGSAPSAAGIDYLVSPTSSNLNNLNSAYYQGFSVENRYMNFAVGLGKVGAGAANFQAHYGSLSLNDAMTQAYTTIFGSAPIAGKVDGLLNAIVTSNGVSETRAQYFAEFGQDGLTGIGTKAAMVGWLLAQAQSADVGTYAQANDAFLTDVALHNAAFGGDIIATYAKPGFAYVAPATATSSGSSGSASTLSLTPEAFIADSASILRLSGSSPAATAVLGSLTTQLTSGAITADAALKAAIALAGGTTSVATMTYEFFTGSAPSAAGMDYLVSPTSPNANNLNSSYYQNISVENRYINFAVSLGTAGAGATNFQAHYGALSLSDATAQAYMTIFGSAPTAAKVDTLLNTLVTSNGVTETRAQYFADYGHDGLTGIGTKAAMVGWLLAQAQSADVGTYAQSNDAFLSDVALHNASFGVDIIGTYAQPGFVYHPG